ncbi:MAG: DUF5947 family protein [Candidatus Acidiferrales bacterium]
MRTLPVTEKDGAFAALRQFARKRPAVERCELCSSELTADHQHLIDPAARKIVCACDPCAVLFSSQNSARYKRVPRHIRFLAHFKMSDSQWDGLMVPIEMAFFLKGGADGKVSAFYPGPAGAIESLLSLEAWDEIEKDNPELLTMEVDVEALLVNRVGAARGLPAQYYIVPIDECYKLVGLIRLNWHGLSGGTEVWREVSKFFAALKERA